MKRNDHSYLRRRKQILPVYVRQDIEYGIPSKNSFGKSRKVGR